MVEKRKKILAIFGNVALFGQERANIQVFEILKEAGHDLLLAVNDRGFHWYIQPEVEQRNLKFAKMRYPWNFRKTLKPKQIYDQLRDIAQCNIHFLKIYRSYRPDVLHVANETNVIALIPALMLVKAPMIYRLGDEPSTHFKLHNFLWKHIISKRVKTFVCISHFIKGKLVSVNEKWQNAEVIHNVPTRRLPEKEDLPPKDDKMITFVYVGQINEIKGVRMLVDAFLEIMEQHQNVRLLLAGDIEHSTLAKELVPKVRKTPYGDRIEFLGEVKDIDSLFSVGDAGIFPSLYDEPLSNVIGEAKINSRPSIIFNSGGMPELVEHKVNGFVASSKSVEGIKEAVAYYLQDPQKLKDHGEKAYQSLEEMDLDYNTFRQKWLDVYNL